LIFLIGLLSITGCVDSAHTVSMLSAADSLVEERPDSAYKLLKTLDNQRIWQSENKAKYALLMTQVKYKTFVKNESDSLINIAVEYYRDSENPDMYARALFYLGTVNADMGDSDAAIENYKAADATGTTDTLLLGFINSNVGWLYTEFSITAEGISRYKAAIKYFKATPRIDAASYAARRLGHIFTIDKMQDSAQYYLHYGYELAAKARDTAGMCHAQMLLVETYVRENELQKAKDAYAKMVQLDSNYVNIAVFHSLSRLYVKEKNIDSARYYLNKCLEGATYQMDTLQYYFAACSVEELAGNYKASLDFLAKANNLENSIQREDAASKLYEIDRRFDKKQLEVEHKHLRNLFNLWVVIAILFACVALMMCGAYVIYRRRRNRERQNYIETLKEQRNAFVDTCANLDRMMNQCLKLEKNARSNLEGRVALIGELIGEAYACGNRYDKFAERFNKLVIKKPLGVDSFADIHAMVNNNYGGIIDYLTTTYPALNGSEIDICALTCIGFTSQQLFILLGAPKIEAIYYKKSIINDKIGIKGDLRKNLFDIIGKIAPK
ncbi:MAG: hypothetical protein RR689_01385, partial [Mucinivorans sp.]